MTLMRRTLVVPGHDCITFRCKWGDERCKPGSAHSHDRGGVWLFFVGKGELGAVALELSTGWLPEPGADDCVELASRTCRLFPLASLSWHSPEPIRGYRIDYGPCSILGSDRCFGDTMLSMASRAFRALCNGGDDELWEFLEQWYRCIFHDEPLSDPKPYPYERRI